MEQNSKQQSDEAATSTHDERAPEEKLESYRAWRASQSSGEVPPPELHLEPGVVEVELQDFVVPRFVAAGDDQSYRMESLGGADLLPFHQALSEFGLLHYEPTFRISQELAAKLHDTARQQGMPVADLTNFVTLFFAPDADVRRIAQALEQLPVVLRAAPVPKGAPPSLGLDDELLGHCDHVVPDPETGLDNQWYVFRCRANRAWEMFLSGRGVIIGLLDHGFWVTHADIATRLDEEHRYNSVDQSNNVSQGIGVFHGTAVAGLVGAEANDFGMVGFAYDAELWPVQANFSLTHKVPANISWANAITWVLTADSGGRRKVILFENQTCRNGNYEEVASVNAAIQTAIANGAVVCVAAGNGDRDAGISDSGQYIPETGSILVGATKHKEGVNERWERSNWGTRITVSAPGDPLHDVTCLAFRDRQHDNDLLGATSGAAAKVAGAVALMMEANPYIRHSDVREILNRTGTHVETSDERPAGRFLDCEAAVWAARCAPAWGTAWRHLPGKALDLVFAPDGSAWHLGSNHVIYQWCETYSRWTARGSADGAVQIAVGADSNIWYFNSAGDIFRGKGSVWQKVPGQALSLTIGASGIIWRVGTDHRMYRWRYGKWEADTIYGSAMKIAVGPDGSPWHIGNPTRDIYRRVSDKWRRVPGQALDLSIGADGSIWHVGLNKMGDGHAMYRWGRYDWEPIDGTAMRVAVAPNGLPWQVNRFGDIFRRI